MTEEMFVSSVREKGDLAGVFEYDGETGYFYLYDLLQSKGNQIISSIHVISGPVDFVEHDIIIDWDQSSEAVGLLIKGNLWAVFDSRAAKYGSDYVSSNIPAISSDIASNFFKSGQRNH